VAGNYDQKTDNIINWHRKNKGNYVGEPLDESLPEENEVESAESDEEESSDAENAGMCFLLGQ
jgi:hypothetical protein